jgi:hypothetical protein
METPTGTTPTATATETQELTLEPTATMTATPSPVLTVMDLIRQGNYLEAVELTQQLVESDKFASMNEAILEVWLPVIRTESDYSDATVERLSSEFSGLEVNEAGLAVIVDSEGEILIE